MEASLIVALVGSVSGLAGTAVGGVISYFSARANRSSDDAAAIRKRSYEERELLYSDFLGEAVRLILLSRYGETKIENSAEFVKLASLEARIWFHSESVGPVSRELAKFVMRKAEGLVDVDPADKLLTFPDLRDKMVKLCTVDLAELRNET